MLSLGFFRIQWRWCLHAPSSESFVTFPGFMFPADVFRSAGNIPFQQWGFSWLPLLGVRGQVAPSCADSGLGRCSLHYCGFPCRIGRWWESWVSFLKCVWGCHLQMPLEGAAAEMELRGCPSRTAFLCYPSWGTPLSTLTPTQTPQSCFSSLWPHSLGDAQWLRPRDARWLLPLFTVAPPPWPSSAGRGRALPSFLISLMSHPFCHVSPPWPHHFSQFNLWFLCLHLVLWFCCPWRVGVRADAS